jgi:CopA family copper-resistance protein
LRRREPQFPLRIPLSRRRFVEGLVGGALLGAACPWSRAGSPSADTLAGPHLDLEIGAMPVNFTGRVRPATVVNGRIPAPTLRWREGDDLRLRVTNRLAVPTSLHWHGVVVPETMDGVPGVSFGGIPAGKYFDYRFTVRQAGTYWYHAHSRFQEQTGLYGAIVIEPRMGERHHAERDYVVLLSDWSDEDPEHIYRTLKRQSDYFNYQRRTLGDLVHDTRTQGLESALAERAMWGRMRMDPTDLLDVSGHTYTYLMNGCTPAGNWTGLFARGERIRLRLINGSSMSFFDVRIPGLALKVIAADGQDVEPVTVEELRIGAAEVYDVLIEPSEERAYTLFAQALDRSGYARGTLAPRMGLEAEVPPLDARPLLGMTDMGMADLGMAPMAHTHDMAGMQASPSMGEMPPTTRHARSEFGPGVDSLAVEPQARLNDPGVGLRGNGRRVLTYADLHTLGGPIDPRAPGREIELHLTGHMQRYMWSFNGEKFSQAEPLRFHYGERLQLVLVNDSMMHHPIHLHGMWSEVLAPDGAFQVRKHTVTVQPGQRLSYAVTADALGRWAYHCHLLYHMEAGMFREVRVERSPTSDAPS